MLGDLPEPRTVQRNHVLSQCGGGAAGVCLTTILPSSGNDWIGLTLAEVYPMSQSRVAFGRFRRATPVHACGLTPGEYRLTAFTKG